MSDSDDPEHRWFAVRCVLQDRPRHAYEERITLWRTRSFKDAIAFAEADARGYARDLEDGTYVGLAQAYELFDEPGHGAEVFSLIRVSALSPENYLSAFFDTGTERQRTTE
jgi:hypothetical protein